MDFYHLRTPQTLDPRVTRDAEFREIGTASGSLSGELWTATLFARSPGHPQLPEWVEAISEWLNIQMSYFALRLPTDTIPSPVVYQDAQANKQRLSETHIEQWFAVDDELRICVKRTPRRTP